MKLNMAREQITKGYALERLMWEGMSSRKNTLTSLRRVWKYCKALGLNGEEIKVIETILEYRSTPQSDYYDYIKRNLDKRV